MILLPYRIIENIPIIIMGTSYYEKAGINKISWL